MSNVIEYNWTDGIDSGKRAGYRFFKIMADLLGTDIRAWNKKHTVKGVKEAEEIAHSYVFAPLGYPFNPNATGHRVAELIEILRPNTKWKDLHHNQVSRILEEALAAGIVTEHEAAEALARFPKKSKPRRGVGSY